MPNADCGMWNRLVESLFYLNEIPGFLSKITQQDLTVCFGEWICGNLEAYSCDSFLPSPLMHLWN